MKEKKESENGIIAEKKEGFMNKENEGGKHIQRNGKQK